MDAIQHSLSDHVENSVSRYFEQLNGAGARDLYKLVLNQVEAPLLSLVMRQVDGNQSQAAEILGLNRGTLRKKLQAHGLMDR